MPTRKVRKPIILVIEDYRDSREMLTLLLESLDYRVLAASNGREAIKLAANQPDLIITDFGLPDMDGLRVVRRIRKLNNRLKYVPIIMLTARERDGWYGPAIKAGCTEFVTKPPDFEKFRVLLEKLLRQNRVVEQDSDLAKTLDLYDFKRVITSMS